MKLENCRKIEKLHAAKPKFQVTGVSFGGYGSQYDGKKKLKVTFGRGWREQSGIRDENSIDLSLDEKMDMAYQRSQPGNARYRVSTQTRQGSGKNPAVKGRKNSAVVSEAPFRKESAAQGYVRQSLNVARENTAGKKEEETEETSAMSNSEKAYFAALALAETKKREKSREVQDKKTKAEGYVSKKSSEETSENQDNAEKKERLLDQQKREAFIKERVLDQQEHEEFTKERVLDQQRREFTKERALDKWKQETAGERHGGANLSRDELTRRCNVRSRGPENMSGVRNSADMAENYMAENEEPEPWVCSETEREKIRQKKADKKEKNKEKEEDKKKRKTDKVKRTLLKRYVIQEMIHEEGKRDPNAHFKLAGQFIAHDLGRLAAFVGKLILKLFLQLFLWLLPVILIAVMVPLMAGYTYMIHPTSYYDNIFDQEDEIAGNPLYLKNVVQEKCRDFAGEMQTLEDNWRHDVSYPYEDYPDADIVTIVYLAQLCTKDNYKDMTTNGEDGYPPYLLVDTEEEQDLLDTVFSQFNYITSTFTIITILGADNEAHPVAGFDTKIYCLTLQEWKRAHQTELSAEAKELLEELEEKIGETGGTAGDFAGSEEAVPIGDLEIPDGVDENLIYMAGFIKAEAGNQPALGKTAVAYVILNRAGGPSGNIKGVLLAPYQFSCYIPYHTVEQYLTAYANMTQEQREADSCYQAAMGAYYGTSANPIGDMKYYCNPKYCSAGETKQWEKIRAKNSPEEIIIIGDHVFCKNCW